MKALKVIGKVFCVLLAVLVVCVISLLIMYRNQIATVNSIEQIDDYPIYTMDYRGTYWFDDFMKTTGMVSSEDFTAFFKSKLTHGVIKNDGAVTERPAAMCTCFVCENENGDILYCRNLEQNRYCPSVVVTTHDGKYDTIGTSFLVPSSDDMPELLNKINMLIEPYFTADGMNDAGLAISLLSVPYSPIPKNENTPLLSSEQVCRLVLNEAGTVEEAVELFDDFTLDATILEPLSACHFLVADKSGSMAVVELHDGKVDVVEPIHNNYMTVTNFYLNDEISNGTGGARYDFVEAALEEKGGVLSEQEALELLASVKDANIHPEWSCVYNLTTGGMYIMPKAQLDNVHEIEYYFDTEN